MDTIPNYWTFKNPVTVTKPVGRFKPYSGPSQTRGFGNGNGCHKWELGNDDSEHDHWTALYAFWEAKYPGVHFYLWDPQLNETRVYEIISDFGPSHYNHGDGYAWNFTIEEVWPYTVIAGQPPEEP